MSAAVSLRHDPTGALEIVAPDGALLWRYIYRPATPAGEAPRPYAHPVWSRAGDVLTNFRPNDHPWHHGLSLTLTSVDGVNFWGGPSYRAGEGYRWRDDHGAQIHREWAALEPAGLEEVIDWIDSRTNRVLLTERRRLATTLHADGWALRWTSELENVAGRDLVLGNYHSRDGLAGSHYTGLQFRGARDLLDEHGDATIGISAAGGARGEAAVHGVAADWMEWSCQHDGSLRRTRLRFEGLEGPIPWFVRAKNPLAAFAFHRENDRLLTAGARLRLDQRLTFTSA